MENNYYSEVFPIAGRKKIVLTDNGCRQLKISKLVRQFIRKGTKYSACKGGRGKHTHLSLCKQWYLKDPRSWEKSKLQTILKNAKHTPMYYLPHLKVLQRQSSVTIYNYIMIMQGKDYVILSFIINILLSN